jgi:uncharacterized alpha-E superfamily protein
MLCRTGNDLYWTARHIERAENTARMIDVARRVALLPERDEARGDALVWRRALDALGLMPAFTAKYGPITPSRVLEFLCLDPDNPSSIRASIRAARESARAQRGAITVEMYEDLNASWLEMRVLGLERFESDGLARFIDWVKTRSASFRGVTIGTMGRDEGYQFMRLGTFIERADNTARILDVKYHTLLPSAGEVGGAVDYYQWGALLRSVSAFDAYRKIYRDVIAPMRVIELLVLRDDVPRSLHVCMNEIYNILSDIADASSLEPERLAGELHAQLHYGRAEKIITFGLHEYLMDVLDKLHLLDNEINQHFLVPVYAQAQQQVSR